MGRAPGRYNLCLGANHTSKILNQFYREVLAEDGLLRGLTPPLAAERQPLEGFGDFAVRTGVVKATMPGVDFHA